ncbi:RluA family pseudouridine synthase [Halobacillus sp. BBL2006]|uniref:RluA family pseudouridine synthase n=1 Tax=Halobacillus sp. BBL2006 TaxID=1543706 RepID=UPI000689E6EB|nr:RluA family pseudouridine synthase [Halobacillus sp. BBL2006]
MARKNKISSTIYKVEQPQELLPFLLETLSTTSRNSVKSILKRGQVVVEKRVQTKHNFELERGQTVEVIKSKVSKRQTSLQGMKILHEDEDIIVIDKSSGLLSMASPKEKQLTAHRQLMNYVRSVNPKNRIFIVHRLDKDTSGVMVFARSEQVKLKFQESWKRMVKERKYVALVEGTLKQKDGTITSYLKESKSLQMYSSSNPHGGQLAVTHYKVKQYNKNFTLLDVHLETGRKNQIRVHMEDLGHPIVGDKKYGANTNPIKRLGLHAEVLAFIHPRTGENLRFQSPVPKSFLSTSK